MSPSLKSQFQFLWFLCLKVTFVNNIESGKGAGCLLQEKRYTEDHEDFIKNQLGLNTGDSHH